MTHYLYISGPITNDPDYMQKFQDCEDWIRRHTKYEPVNPSKDVPWILRSDGIENPTHNDYMRVSINLLTEYPNTSIVMLPDWQISNGAKFEYNTSYFLNYKSYFFNQKDIGIMDLGIKDLPKEMMK